MKFIVKMVKKLFLAADLGHISRVQSRGPGRRLWLSNIPGQAKGQARLGLAFFGLAWPGFWPQAGAGTSLKSTLFYFFYFLVCKFLWSPFVLSFILSYI